MSFLVNSYALGWTPSELGSALALWLDAADVGTITLNGSNVSQWNDKSGRARHAVQSLSSAQPFYLTSDQNSLNTVRALVGDILGIPALSLTDGAMIVYVFSSETVNYGVVDTGDITSWDRFASASYQNHFRSVRLNGIASAAGPATNTGWHLRSVLANSATPIYTIRNNGSTVYSDTGTFTFSSNIASVNKPFESAIKTGEIIVVDEFSQQTMERLEGYLAHKWGLVANLPSDHPYKTVAP